MNDLKNIVIIFAILFKVRWLYKYNIIHLTCLQYLKVASAAETYRAAVVEYSPDCDPNEPTENIFKRSVTDYVKYIEDAGKQVRGFKHILWSLLLKNQISYM